ncbi:MAG: tRNA (guanine-N1)-methyltransferase, partial [Owenweeksia sp.]
MRKRFLPILLVFLVGSQATVNAQDDNSSLDSGSLKSQFEYLVDKSNNYQDYKVIKKSWLDKMQSHISDSLTQQQELRAESKNIIDQQASEIRDLQEQLVATQDSLGAVTAEK